MKALEKDRRRRYETANDFAADVMRYLTDQPVEACPPSAWYRFAKFARRNRAALTTVALVALALVAGTAVSTWQAIGREAERVPGGDRRTSSARQAVDEMYTQVAEKWLKTADVDQVQREFLEKALAFYEQFAAETGPDPRVRYETMRRASCGAIRRPSGGTPRPRPPIVSLALVLELALSAPIGPNFFWDRMRASSWSACCGSRGRQEGRRSASSWTAQDRVRFGGPREPRSEAEQGSGMRGRELEALQERGSSDVESDAGWHGHAAVPRADRRTAAGGRGTRRRRLRSGNRS